MQIVVCRREGVGTMKKVSTSAGAVIIAGLALCVWWYGTHGGNNAVRAAVKGPQPIKIKQKMTVEAGKGQQLSYEFPKTPGRLYGHWSSKGISAQIKGANDDTLVAFQLIGPNNDKLQDLGKATGGNFDIRINSPGRYTFVFDNQGIIRSSARVAEIEATYQPD